MNEKESTPPPPPTLVLDPEPDNNQPPLAVQSATLKMIFDTYLKQGLGAALNKLGMEQEKDPKNPLLYLAGFLINEVDQKGIETSFLWIVRGLRQGCPFSSRQLDLLNGQDLYKLAATDQLKFADILLVPHSKIFARMLKVWTFECLNSGKHDILFSRLLSEELATYFKINPASKKALPAIVFATVWTDTKRTMKVVDKYLKKSNYFGKEQKAEFKAIVSWKKTYTYWKYHKNPSGILCKYIENASLLDPSAKNFSKNALCAELHFNGKRIYRDLANMPEGLLKLVFKFACKETYNKAKLSLPSEGSLTSRLSVEPKLDSETLKTLRYFNEKQGSHPGVAWYSAAVGIMVVLAAVQFVFGLFSLIRGSFEWIYLLGWVWVLLPIMGQLYWEEKIDYSQRVGEWMFYTLIQHYESPERLAQAIHQDKKFGLENLHGYSNRVYRDLLLHLIFHFVTAEMQDRRGKKRASEPIAS